MPDDTGDLDAIVRAVYETIPGRAGPRDWERERRLFAPGALLVPTQTRPEVGAAAQVFDIEGFIASRAPFFAANDFYEREVARRTFRFGNVAHVESAYEALRKPGDREALWRGINSIQLYHDGRRWWIVSIAWDNERPGNPLPDWAAARS